MEKRIAYEVVGSLESGGFSERVVIELNFDSAKKLHHTLSHAAEQLKNSNSFLYHADFDDVEVAQKQENEHAYKSLQDAMSNLERIFPSLKE